MTKDGAGMTRGGQLRRRESLSLDDIEELLGLELTGVIPESRAS